MNKPAAKEPSMDEILSSIRQIIADDDAANSGAGGPIDISDEPPEEEIPSFDAFLEEETAEEPPETPDEPEAAEDDIEALALSLDQVVADSESADDDDAGMGGDLPSPEDLAFVSELADFDIEPEPELAPEPEPEPEPEPISAMPDPELSSDLTEHLLDETTAAATSEAFSKLGVLSLGAGGQTIEGVVKELLRPMLKAWLDENLPSIVERLVEREIERVSRGGR